MGGFFGVAAKNDCSQDLFYGTDYHSHLGTMRGGLAVYGETGIKRHIHDITNSQFRHKFETDIEELTGNTGIGVISDFDDQPLIIGSHLGTYAIVTVGKLSNAEQLAEMAFENRNTHFSEMSGMEINPTEIVATLINSEANFEDGIRYAQKVIDGSCSMLIMTDKGIYAARDRLGRTPIVIGRKDGAYSATMESSVFPNLDYKVEKFLGPGEVVLITADGIEEKIPAGDEMQICSFLWVYYGYPSSCYEGINTEATRYKCGACLADEDAEDGLKLDIVAGVPDSGTAHAIGYANRAGVSYGRPFVKYTPTWPRSFMPQKQSVRDLVARMKLIPVEALIAGKSLLFCEDSIVRGTQLQDTVRRLFDSGAEEIHMRPACPPLTYGCKFLNFSRSRSELDLATRRAIKELEGDHDVDLAEYSNPDSEKYAAMVELIRKTLNLTSLKFQKLDNLVKAIGIPKEKLCTYCWDGCEGGCGGSD